MPICLTVLGQNKVALLERYIDAKLKLTFVIKFRSLATIVHASQQKPQHIWKARKTHEKADCIAVATCFRNEELILLTARRFI